MRSSLVAIGAGLNLAKMRGGLYGDGCMTATPPTLDSDDDALARCAATARVSVWNGTVGGIGRSDIR